MSMSETACSVFASQWRKSFCSKFRTGHPSLVSRRLYLSTYWTPVLWAPCMQYTPILPLHFGTADGHSKNWRPVSDWRNSCRWPSIPKPQDTLCCERYATLWPRHCITRVSKTNWLLQMSSSRKAKSCILHAQWLRGTATSRLWSIKWCVKLQLHVSLLLLNLLLNLQKLVSHLVSKSWPNPATR